MESDQARSEPADPNVKALDRGLRVITAIADAAKPFTVSEIAKAVGITRPAARRFILTLEHLGYVALHGNAYELRPCVVEIGETYLTSQPLPSIAHPYLEELAAEIAETVSLTVLHGGLVTYIDRVQADRILAINIVVGSRVPADATATGRVLLAGLCDADLEAYFSSLETHGISLNPDAELRTLRSKVADARRQNWFLADQEFRRGIVSLAVPVTDGDARTIAAVNISASTSRASAALMESQFLEPLRKTAQKVSAAFLEKSSAQVGRK